MIVVWLGLLLSVCTSGFRTEVIFVQENLVWCTVPTCVGGKMSHLELLL